MQHIESMPSHTAYCHILLLLMNTACVYFCMLLVFLITCWCFSAWCWWQWGCDQWRWASADGYYSSYLIHSVIHSSLFCSFFWLSEFDKFLAGRAKAADHLPSMKSSSSAGVGPASPRQAEQEQNLEQIFRLWHPPHILMRKNPTVIPHLHSTLGLFLTLNLALHVRTTFDSSWENNQYAVCCL